MCLINRKCFIYHYAENTRATKVKDYKGHYSYPTERLLWGKGTLLQFAQDFEELRDGVGTTPVGIVELLTGELKIVPIHLLEMDVTDD